MEVARVSMMAYSASIRARVKEDGTKLTVEVLVESRLNSSKEKEEKYQASHMTASIPYPRVTGVNIHAFILCRGVLRHR
jgi:hypothetical protein